MRVVLLLVASASIASSFNLQMVSRSNSRRNRSFNSRSVGPLRLQPQSQTINSAKSSGKRDRRHVSAAIISRLSVKALKNRLAAHSSIECDVTASSKNLLLHKQVGPVKVRGRGCATKLGLTSRVVEATMEQMDLDMQATLRKRKLVLTTHAQGNAMVAMDARDVANFLDYILVDPPIVSGGEHSQGACHKVEYVKELPKIDTNTETVIFNISYLETKYRCELKRGSDASARVIIDVFPAMSDIPDGTSKILTETMTAFVDNSVFELYGSVFTLQDLMVTEKGGGATLMVALDVTVRKDWSERLDIAELS